MGIVASGEDQMPFLTSHGGTRVRTSCPVFPFPVLDFVTLSYLDHCPRVSRFSVTTPILLVHPCHSRRRGCRHRAVSRRQSGRHRRRTHICRGEVGCRSRTLINS